jgi:hypothetical protein
VLQSSPLVPPSPFPVAFAAALIRPVARLRGVFHADAADQDGQGMARPVGGYLDAGELERAGASTWASCWMAPTSLLSSR